MTTLDSQATHAALLAAETYGPRPPTARELLAARNAPPLAVEAGCGVDEYERLVLAKLDTEAAFREAEARAYALPPEPEAEAEPW
jgi:hypothetical protein